jgi:hypothetical protein
VRDGRQQVAAARDLSGSLGGEGMRMRSILSGWQAMAVVLCALLMGLTGCGSNTPGRMEWVQPLTTGTPRVGTVYCIRGWKGVFSWGIDEMAQKLNEQGVHAYVYMPEQYPELAEKMVEEYKKSPNHEPICFIGHSRGVDSSIIISRELEKAGVPVDLIICLDSVDEKVLPANVKLCHNFWMPGFFYGTNLFRGIPLEQEPGSTGTLYNINLNEKEGEPWHEFGMYHIDMDKRPKLQKHIIELILETCPERSKWTPPATAPAKAAAPTTLTR